MSDERQKHYRRLEPPDLIKQIFDDFLARLEEMINDPRLDRNDVVRDALYQIYFGDTLDWEKLGDQRIPIAGRALLASLDPRSSTTEPEYYQDIDLSLYYPRKPLIWLWQMFDRSPLGLNAALGFRFRRMLAPYIFKSVGKNFKCFHFVEWSYGYNMSIGDDVVIHRHVLLDDRGGIEIGSRVSISDYANIYSHSHAVNDIYDIKLDKTIIEDDARVTYHTTVLSGTRIGKHGLLGAMGVLSKNIADYHIHTGIPAKSVAVKSIAPAAVEAPGRAPSSGA